MVNQKASDAVQAILDATTSSISNGIAGLVAVSIDQHGDIIQSNASGTKGLNSASPMDLDTVFWIASCTKLVAGIACLQLVEKGALVLDDARHLYSICPELERVQVLQADGTLRPRKNDITLRMLLSHTAGFGYEFFHEGLREFGRPVGFDCFAGDESDILRMPLVHEPGTDWQYGVGLRGAFVWEKLTEVGWD